MVSPALGATVRELRGGRPRLVDSALRRLPKHLIHETVLDTNILLAALRSKRGASHQLLRLIGEGEWRLNVSVALALEYEEVLKRNRLASGPQRNRGGRVPGLPVHSFQLDSHCATPPAKFADPDDEHILEVAVECGAMIISHNIRDFVGAERLGVEIGR